MSASSIGTCTIAEPSGASNVSLDSMPPRVTVSRPEAGANGALTRSSAVSPGAYVSASGMIVTCSCSTLRSGRTPPPLTQRVNTVRLLRPASSWTTASI